MATVFKVADAVVALRADMSELNRNLGSAERTVKKTMGNILDLSKQVGVGMTALGAGIMGAMGGAIASFASYAENIDTVAKKTGFSTDAVQEFKFVAEQTSATLDDVTNAVKFMANNLDTAAAKAADGADMTGTAFGRLGLDVNALKGMKPEAAFTAILAELSKIPDQMQRTAIAQDIFGKGAMALQPMLAEGAGGIQRLREEAHRLGLVMTSENIVAGEAFGDEMQKIKSMLMPFAAEIATTLMPVIKDLASWLRDTVKEVTAWIRENPQLTATIIKVTAGAGALFSILGPFLIILPGLVSAFAAIGPVVTAVGVVLGALSLPVVAVIAGIAALIAAGVLLYQNWDQVAVFLGNTWETIKTVFADAFAAVGKGLAAGWDWIKSLFEKGIYGLGYVVGVGMGFVSRLFTDPIGTVMDVWSGLWGFFEKGFDNLVGVLGASFDAIRGLWSTLAGWFSSSFDKFVNIFLHPVDAITNAWNGVVDFFGRVGDWFGSFVDWLAGGIGYVIDWLRYLYNWVANLFGAGAVTGFTQGALGGGVPQFAAGGIVQSPLQIVGEQGAELAALPMGTHVFTADETQDMLNSASPTNATNGASVTVHNTFSFPNLTIREEADIGRISREIARTVKIELAGALA